MPNVWMLRVRRSTADAGADNGGHNNGDLVYSMEDWEFMKLTTVPWAVILMVVNGLVVVTGCDLDLESYYCFMVFYKDNRNNRAKMVSNSMLPIIV